MQVEQAIGNILVNAAGLTALVNERIFSPLARQSTTFPLVVYRVTSRERDTLLEAPGRSGLTRTRFRVFSSMNIPGGYAQAKNVDKQVRLALEGFQGTVVDGTVSPAESVEIQGIFAGPTFDQYDDKTEVHSIISDFDVWHDEEV